MAKRLFVGGLSWNTTDEMLKEHFSKIGEVSSASVITDKFSGRSKGFGFVEMVNDEEADKAVKELGGQEFDGRVIAVDIAKPQAQREDRFSGGGRRDSGRRDDRRY